MILAHDLENTEKYEAIGKITHHSLLIDHFWHI